MPWRRWRRGASHRRLAGHDSMPMTSAAHSETRFFFATLAALLAAKDFALTAVGKGRFDGLPRPTQIDRSRSSRQDAAS